MKVKRYDGVQMAVLGCGLENAGVLTRIVVLRMVRAVAMIGAVVYRKILEEMVNSMGCGIDEEEKEKGRSGQTLNAASF